MLVNLAARHRVTLVSTGAHDPARSLLAEIYGWFTEGFEIRDLRAAKLVLDELSQKR